MSSATKNVRLATLAVLLCAFVTASAQSIRRPDIYVPPHSSYVPPPMIVKEYVSHTSSSQITQYRSSFGSTTHSASSTKGSAPRSETTAAPVYQMSDDEFVRITRKEAEAGDRDAQLALGHYYMVGWHVAQDSVQASKWYRRAAEQGSNKAHLSLGLLYESMLPADRASAYAWYMAAVDLGNADAEYHVGRMFELGLNPSPEDVQRAVAADPKLKFHLTSVLNGVRADEIANRVPLDVLSTDPKVAVPAYWYTRAANGGSPLAQNRLGLLYESGALFVRNEKAAVDWYRRAAESGYAPADYNLALTYELGNSVVEKNDREALRWYHDGVEKGHEPSILKEAEFYEAGRGIAKPWPEKALELYTHLAHKDSIEGAMRTARMYEEGRGTKRNKPDLGYANMFYRIAFRNGSDEAGYKAGQVSERRYGEHLPAYDDYKEVAERGYAPAQLRCGELLEKAGASFGRLKETPMVWYMMAAAQGDERAIAAVKRLGGTPPPVVMRAASAAPGFDFNIKQIRYVETAPIKNVQPVTGGVQSDEIAKTRSAADAGDAKAQSKMAQWYMDGRVGLSADKKQACYWGRKAASQGDLRGRYFAATCLIFGWDGVKDEAEGINLMKEVAESGMAWAQEFVGSSYNEGLYTLPKNARMASKYLTNAAEQGDARAALELGSLLFFGDSKQGFPADQASGFRYLLQAADAGDAQAQFDVGMFFEQGLYVAVNRTRALGFYLKAVKQNYGDAEYRAGLMYLKGDPVAQDVDQAFQLIRRAAQQGIPEAELRLGIMYAEGKATKSDYHAAVEWVRKSARHGNKDAIEVMQVWKEKL